MQTGRIWLGWYWSLRPGVDHTGSRVATVDCRGCTMRRRVFYVYMIALLCFLNPEKEKSSKKSEKYFSKKSEKFSKFSDFENSKNPNVDFSSEVMIFGQIFFRLEIVTYFRSGINNAN